jgi:hypothetical protein
MTKEEAKEWYDRLPEEERIQILMEHTQLKQHLCAQTLLIPTGTKNWVFRAIRKAEHLHECERQLRRIVNQGGEMIEEVRERAFRRQCSNCMGKGVTESHNSDPAQSCVICHGTGVLPYPA